MSGPYAIRMLPEVATIDCTDSGMISMVCTFDLGFGVRIRRSIVLSGCLVLPDFRELAKRYAEEWIKCGRPHCTALVVEAEDPPDARVLRQEGDELADLADDLIAQGMAARDSLEELTA